MWHTVLIAAHAVSGTVALLAGCFALARGVLFGVYLWSLLAMEVFLVAAIAEEWTELGGGLRLLFVAFALLGAVMVGRAGLARRVRPAGSSTPSLGYLHHVGFTLVALFDAFIVILVLDFGGPVWLIVAVGVAVAVVGHYVLKAVVARLSAPEPAALT